MSEFQKHHILFPRKLYDANIHTRVLRQNQWLIPALEPEVHRALHSRVVIVPPMDGYVAGRVRQDFSPIRGNFIGTVYELMSSIHLAVMHPSISPIQIENAQVAVHALEQQIPFIREGTCRNGTLRRF